MSLYSKCVVGGALCCALTFTISAHASIEYTCSVMPGSFDCEVDQDCGPLYDEPSGCDQFGNNCDPDPVVCQVPNTSCSQMNGAASCGWHDVIGTPSVVWRSFNGVSHAYTAQAAPPQGYTLEGIMFNLANDGYGGAVEFPLTGGGPLFYYPTSDSSARSIDRDLAPLYNLYNPTYGDHLYTTDPSEAQNFPCVPAHCVYVTPAGYCGVVAPPNCYLNLGVYGYVG